MTLLSLVLNRILLQLSRTLGIRNHDESIIRWSGTSKPALGGISFFIVFLVAYLSYVFLFNPAATAANWQHAGILGATVMAFLMGLSDDAYNTTPLLKFGVQVGCGLLLAFTGTCIELFSNPWLNYALTVLWVVAVMNSINMLDNMDAITTLVSSFILAIALMVCLAQATVDVFFLVLLLGSLGGLLGFLYYNWNPSKMFMGDTGSQFLGIILSVAGIAFFWNDPSGATDSALRQILLVALAFIIPISDTATVIINRLRRGQSPFVGGKDHTTHHLSYLGLTDRQVALLFGAICSVSFAISCVIVNFIPSSSPWFYGFFAVYFLAVLGGLYYTTQHKKAKARFHAQSS
ncbi:MAG: MraY family glycosyltransferase [Salibacteraceae bacterium]